MSSLPHRASLVGSPGYRICVAVAGATAAELMNRATTALSENRLIELRLDALPQPALAHPLLQQLSTLYPTAILLATCRRTVAGGAFHGTAAEEMAILASAARHGCALVDLAMESADEATPAQLQHFRAGLRAAGTACLLSSHDFVHTGDLQQTFFRLAHHAPDLAKIVCTAATLSDNLPLLRLLGEPSDIPRIGIAMGEPGLASRVLALRAGALFTFASAAEGQATAPGQLTAGALRSLYRADQLGPETRVYGVAGQPLQHSLSPRMHTAAFATLGIDAVYLPLATASAAELMHFARELPVHGLSVTMPLKRDVLSYLDWIDPLAARVGACNTLVRTESGAWHGYNTDVDAVIGPLEKRLPLPGARVLVLGAGGAARAAVFGLSARGADVWILNRTPASAHRLAAEAGARVAEPSMLTPASFDVLLNATPAGMQQATAIDLQGEPGREPDPEPPLCARLVFDMVYNPLETPLLQRARAEGLPLIPGVEMFVSQGARQCELWTGRPAPEDTMLHAVMTALREREGPSTPGAG
ncbi:MAG TPA: type I 3-dehydroquinate dehydratase [Acidobacteriaceae bacterium]